MKLSEMKQVLAERRLELTKSLGQNFLHDGNQLRRIADLAELSPDDKVLEIGPGLGPLTELLIARAGSVLAIEKDARLVEFLRERFSPGSPESKLTLLHADALEYLRTDVRDWREWKLVANLPYSVASPILVELAQAVQRPARMVATLQIEVARRLMAQSGTSDYGVLTLLMQLDYEPQGWFRIPASCFHPAPDVDSACICLARRTQPLLDANRREAFYRIVKRGFSQRRKMMLKLLKADWPADRLEAAFEKLGVSAKARAESLSLDQFVALARCMAVEKE